MDGLIIFLLKENTFLHVCMHMKEIRGINIKSYVIISK